MSEKHQLKRLPRHHHHSLKAWNAADELLIKHIRPDDKMIGIYNDSFGYLSCQLIDYSLAIITDLRSQEEAIRENIAATGKMVDGNIFHKLTSTLSKTVDIALLKIPKSLDLFELYLQHIHQSISENGTVYCGFMTKYFNASLLKKAEKYFSNISQTKAEKKARVIILSGKKALNKSNSIESYHYNDKEIQQYKGIFSGGKIDAATDFLITNLNIPSNAHFILDLACGNGIIGLNIMQNTALSELHLLDDSHLAIASAKMNIRSEQAFFHHAYHLNDFKNNTFDWIITNPPFHFGHTIDIGIPLQLFKEAYEKLAPNGILTIVANKNLGYEKHLRALFKQVSIVNQNHQFKIYECRK